MSDNQTDPQEGLCVTYRRDGASRLTLLWDEWKPLDLWTRPWRYFIGNCSTFGFWSGVRSNICILSPLANKLLNWKYRRMTLRIDLPEPPHAD